MSRLVVMLPLLVGCGWSWDKYVSEKEQATCEQLVACGVAPAYGWTTVDDCLADPHITGEEGSTACDGYDGSAAKKCITAYLAVDCDNFTGIYNDIDVCNQVCPNSGDTGT